MLTNQEKESLYNIIVATFGEDAAFKQYKLYYNEQTVEVVEKAISEKMKCNRAMKELIVGLLQGGSVLANRWLRRLLRNARRVIRKEEFQLDGFACLAVAKSKWRTSILASAM